MTSTFRQDLARAITHRDRDSDYWWLSFVDRAEDPAGEHRSTALRLGVSVVRTYPDADISHAVQVAWDNGCNPGGEVRGERLDYDLVAACDVPLFRLLDEAEVTITQALIAEYTQSTL